MAKPRLLDLCCGAGGSSDGYAEAGFDVVGVDVDPQPNYPYEFHQARAVEFPLEGFVAVHASPPCQRFSVGSKHLYGDPEGWPNLIDPIRGRLQQLGVPYVIENVVGAPLRDPVMLCGTMFPGLRVLRHRLFEVEGFELPAPPHPKHPLVYTRDKRKPHYGRLNEWTDYVQVTGGGNCTVAAAQDAMGITRPMTKHDLNEALPPAYTAYVGKFLMEALGG